MLEVEAANHRALERVLASEPWLVGVRPAGEVVPGLAPETILHAAPPTSWSEMSEVLRGGVIGAALFEGLASEPEEAEAKARAGAISFAAAQDHAAMAGGAGAVTRSLPVIVLEDRATGKSAFHFLMEGFGRTLILGMLGDEIFERLRWFRDELGPALDAALRAVGGIDVRALMAEALRRGDELHNRNAAATSMLAERLAPGFARAGVQPELQERAFDFLRGNPQFFVAVSLAASRLAADAAADVEGSSVLTALGANGRDCGIKVAGLGDRWFVAPAGVPKGVFLGGFGPEDAGRACGDSLLVECFGLGATVLPAAPALWPLLGADEAHARLIFDETGVIALGEHHDFLIPFLSYRGEPTGCDV